jgi:hypothetical protein
MYISSKLLGNLILIFVVIFFQSCEDHTKLTIEGGNPPSFVLSGSGDLISIRVRGPHKQREGDGEAASLYWEIKYENIDAARPVEDIGRIVYGKIPNGYIQKLPENGAPPPLKEGERYNIRVSTLDANGADKFFEIIDGKPVEVQ